MKTLKTQLLNTLKIIILASIVVLGVQYVSATTWVAPTGNPPTNNTPAPINGGGTAQEKTGGLIVGSGSGVSLGLLVKNGLTVSNGPVTLTTTISGSAPSTGYFLAAADTGGLATWAPLPAGGLGGGGITLTDVFNYMASNIVYHSKTGSWATQNIQISCNSTELLIACSGAPGSSYYLSGNNWYWTLTPSGSLGGTCSMNTSRGAYNQFVGDQPPSVTATCLKHP